MTERETPAEAAKRKREERLAAQLRENLRRRKEQAKAHGPERKPNPLAAPDDDRES